MTVLTPEAEQRVQRYLNELRATLRGCRRIDPLEVERDVREHIDRDLADEPTPVEPRRVDEVLERLGSPDRWIAEEDLPWWRRTLIKLQKGPEDYRMSYLCLGLLLLGFAFSPLLLMGSFLLARCIVAMTGAASKMGAHRWLIYPSLLIVYGLIGVVALAIPLVVADAIEHDSFRSADGWDHVLSVASQISGETAYLCGTALLIGVWFLLLGALAAIWPRSIQAILRPFADGFSRSHGLLVMFVGIGLAVIAFVVVAVMRVA
jgi:hypothetical protein